MGTYMYHLYCATNCNIRELLGFEIFMAVDMKSSIAWDIIPCGPLKIWCFWGTCSLHFHVWITQERNQHKVGINCCLLHVGFFVGLFFKPEEVSNIFLQNVGSFSVEYTALHPRRQNSSLQNFFQFTQYLRKKYQELTKAFYMLSNSDHNYIPSSYNTDTKY
jgi:hypothetical protein